MTHTEGAAIAPHADDRLMFRVCTLTLHFASIELPVTVDLDLANESLGAPRTLNFLTGSDIIV